MTIMWNENNPGLSWPASEAVMQPGWKCTDCGLVLAPRVETHRCQPATLTVTAGMTGTGTATTATTGIVDWVNK
jgi:hypothetical protein